MQNRNNAIGIVVALVLVMSGCGSTPAASTFNQAKSRFINLTSFPDSQVTPTWENEIAQAADWIGKGYHGVPGAGVTDLDGNIVSTPSPELDVQVHQVAASLRGIIVETRPDISAAIVNATPNCRFCPYTNPTGFINCPPNNHGMVFCQAYTEAYGDIVVPAGHPENFGAYEIMITLLHYCGKDPQNM